MTRRATPPAPRVDLRDLAGRHARAAGASLAGLQLLLPLLGSGGGLARMAVVVAAVTLGAAAAELLAPAAGRAAAAVLTFVGGAVAGATSVVATSVAGEALLGVVPGPHARADLVALWHAARQDVATYAPPVPQSAGMLLLLAVSALGVAVAVDALSAGLRRPALAGLPLLGVLVVPAALAPHGVGAVRFAVAALGYLLLLAGDAPQRALSWLGAERAGSAPDNRWAAPAPCGRRGATAPAAAGWVAAAAVLLAAVAPAFLPTLHRQQLGGGSGDGGGQSAAVSVADPLLTVRQRLLDRRPRELLRWRTSGAADYLRLTVLERFDGTQWVQTTLRGGSDHRVSRGLPPVDGLAADVATRDVRVAVHVGPALLEHWLPLPYPPASVRVGGDWKYDDASRVVFSARDDTRRLDYTATALEVRPTAAQLRAGVGGGPGLLADPPVDQGLQTVPVPPDLALTAARVAGTGTRAEQAERLQRFFHDGFRYDLAVPGGNGLAAVERLLATRRGYCEQFASAMALFARLVGIPARVAIGFTPGADLGDGERVVTTHDAHSWPELFLPGAGWLRYEPTPRGDGQAEAPPWARDGRTAPAPAAGRRAALPRPSASAEPATPRRELPRAARRPAPEPAPLAAPRHRLPRWPLLLLLLALPGTARVAVRRRRLARAAAGDAGAAWAELTSTARDLGVPRDPATGPRGTARRLAERTDGSAAGALQRLALAEERARYARPGDAGGEADLAAAVSAALPALRGPASRGRRLVAALLPLSLVPQRLVPPGVVPRRPVPQRLVP